MAEHAIQTQPISQNVSQKQKTQMLQEIGRILTPYTRNKYKIPRDLSDDALFNVLSEMNRHISAFRKKPTCKSLYQCSNGIMEKAPPSRKRKRPARKQNKKKKPKRKVMKKKNVKRRKLKC